MSVRHPGDVDSVAHVFVDDLYSPALGHDDEHHLDKVLRVRDGEIVTASDGAGSFRACRFNGRGVLEIAGAIVLSERIYPPLVVCFALLKGDKNDYVVQKLTEIGIDRIVPFAADRSVARWDDAKWEKNMIRFSEIARNAAMQSRRVTFAHLGLPGALGLRVARFGDVVTLPGAAVAQRGGGRISETHRTILVGPEGGWSAHELALANETVGLFDEVLRAETASVAVGTLMASYRGMPAAS